MTIHDTDIQLIQKRFHAFRLSEEQARRIYRHEEDKSIYDSKLSFSYWEKADYNRHFFQSVLNEEQFSLYEQQSKENILHHEKQLAAQDGDKHKEIAYYTELLHYYKNTLLPSLYKPQVFPFFGLLFSERTKTGYLKAEYKKFVQHARKDLLVAHFRNNRLFMPNQLKVSLLRHSLDFYLPDYHAFSWQMDAPTKSMAQYFTPMVLRLKGEPLETINNIFDQSEAFIKNIRGNYFEETGGWHVDISVSEEEATITKLMSVLLIDKDYYEVDKYDY